MTLCPLDLIRSRFPALSNSRTAHLDNPAGTLVPESVIAAVTDTMATASANLGGHFAASQRADAIWRHPGSGGGFRQRNIIAGNRDRAEHDDARLPDGARHR